MLKTIYIVIAILLSSGNCSKESKQQINCSIINGVIKYLKENEKEFKMNNFAIFNRTDALPFVNFRQEIKDHYPNIYSKIIDSIDHHTTPQRINCKIKEKNHVIEVAFSNIYKNLVICEWFYVDRSRNQNDLNDMRRFKEAKNYLFEFGKDYKIKQVYKKTIQYE